MRKYLLQPELADSPASLWDYTPERHAANPDWHVVEQATFSGGGVGMVPVMETSDAL